MVQIFRKNWFVFTLLLFPYTILTRIWIFFGIPDWPVNTEDQSLVYQYVEQFFPGSYLWNVIAASVLVFINAVQINFIVIKNRIAREITLFPGMLFILLSAFHKDMFWLSPQLLAITFLLLSISNIFRIYQKPVASRFIFNSGLYLGLASIIYLPYSLFLLFAFIAIINLRKIQIRDFIQLLSGYFLIFFFVTFLRYWNDMDFNFFLDFRKQMNISYPVFEYSLNEYLIFALIVILILISVFNFRKFTIKKSIQSQKKVNLFYWLLFIAFICLLFSLKTLFFPALLILFISLAVFMSMLMSRYRNEAALELIHLFILFFIIFSHFWF